MEIPGIKRSGTQCNQTKIIDCICDKFFERMLYYFKEFFLTYAQLRKTLIKLKRLANMEKEIICIKFLKKKKLCLNVRKTAPISNKSRRYWLNHDNKYL